MPWSLLPGRRLRRGTHSGRRAVRGQPERHARAPDDRRRARRARGARRRSVSIVQPAPQGEGTGGAAPARREGVRRANGADGRVRGEGAASRRLSGGPAPTAGPEERGAGRDEDTGLPQRRLRARVQRGSRQPLLDPELARQKISTGRRLLEEAIGGLDEAESAIDHYRAADVALEGRLRVAAAEISAAEISERSARKAGASVEPENPHPEYDRLAKVAADRAARRDEFDPREALAAVDALIQRGPRPASRDGGRGLRPRRSPGGALLRRRRPEKGQPDARRVRTRPRDRDKRLGTRRARRSPHPRRALRGPASRRRCRGALRGG